MGGDEFMAIDQIWANTILSKVCFLNDCLSPLRVSEYHLYRLQELWLGIYLVPAFEVCKEIHVLA